MGQETKNTMSFFSKLAKDATANTLAISAASLIPLMAMVGGGVDASRFYMAEARLQAACDAGALAARRAMSNNEFDDVVQGTNKTPGQIGDSFFDENFSDGLFGIKSLQNTYTATDDGEVNGTASGTMPTSIMAAFGFTDISLSVTCQADINIANTDIVLTLDTTGSMAGTKIQNLREATMSFYDIVTESTSDNAQVRYGIVPYNNQVNVGHLLQSNWMKSTHTYQSRETRRTFGPPTIQSIDVVRTGGAYNFQDLPDQLAYSEVHPTFADCVDVAFTHQPGNNEYLSHDIANLTLVSQSGISPRVSVYEGPASFLNLRFSSGFWIGRTTDTNRECRLTFDRQSYLANATITIVEEVPYTWEWEYMPVSYDVSGVRNTGFLSTPTGADGGTELHFWNGCIEEADTVNANTWDPVPAGAHDLDIDAVPSSNSERWAPMLSSLLRPRFRDNSFKFLTSNFILENMLSLEDKEGYRPICPKPVRQLDEITNRRELEDYLAAENGFIADGATLHDIGMVWAGRMISPDGIFASRNATAPNGEAISRHVVFMTDGVMFANNLVYSPYGYEWWDRRVTDDGNQYVSTLRHSARFQAACRAVRNKNITVWVIAFGTSLSQNLIDCATPGRAYFAANGDELDRAFRDIGEKIADLRLTQ